MGGAWKVGSDAELAAIAAAGAGYVIDPFSRRYHTAACPRVQAMTTGQPKWFAPTAAARDTYLRQRMASYPSAKTIEACTHCGTVASLTAHEAQSAPAPPGLGIARADQRPPFVEHLQDGFQVWADQYVRNESPAQSPAGELRRLLAGEIRALPEPGGSLLLAEYAGRRGRRTDVENLLFNNIDQQLALFRRAGRKGVGFEDLGVAVAAAPDSTSRTSFYRYRLAAPGAPFETVKVQRLVCSVHEVVVPAGPARLSARIWLAVRRAVTTSTGGVPSEDGDFVLLVDVGGMEPAASLKAIVDGATAAMQRDDPGRLWEATTRLSTLLGADADELLALATAGNAPLGAKSHSSSHSKDNLFTLDGTDQVRVTPDDHRCVAARIVSSSPSGPPRLTVEAYSARR